MVLIFFPSSSSYTVYIQFRSFPHFCSNSNKIGGGIGKNKRIIIIILRDLKESKSKS